MPVELALQGLGLGAVLVGVPEHADHIQSGGSQEGLELVEILLCLSREPDDDVGPDAGKRSASADLVDQVEECLGRAKPAHGAQQSLGGVLKGDVEVRDDNW